MSRWFNELTRKRSMIKPLSQKRQTVKELGALISLSKKIARQINRKIEELAQVNKMKAAAKQRLVEICGLR